MATLKTEREENKDDYETDTGNALGVGFDWEYTKKWSLDFDLFFVDYEVPEGYKRKDNSDIKISVGFGYHF